MISFPRRSGPQWNGLRLIHGGSGRKHHTYSPSQEGVSLFWLNVVCYFDHLCFPTVPDYFGYVCVCEFSCLIDILPKSHEGIVWDASWAEPPSLGRSRLAFFVRRWWNQDGCLSSLVSSEQIQIKHTMTVKTLVAISIQKLRSTDWCTLVSTAYRVPG